MQSVASVRKGKASLPSPFPQTPEVKNVKQNQGILTKTNLIFTSIQGLAVPSETLRVHHCIVY